MTDSADSLKALYQSIVLEHSRSPHNTGRLEEPSTSATGHNPLCGDKITVFVQADGDSLTALKFEATACAICTASASIMTETVDNRSRGAASETIRRTLDAFEHQRNLDDLPGDMAAFAEVCRYPSRVKCATLPWQTLHVALNENTTTTTTE